jgi:hypothetical protein
VFLVTATGIDPRLFFLSLQADMAATDKMIFRKLRRDPGAICLSNILLADGRPFYSNSLSDLITEGYVAHPLLYTNEPGELRCRALALLTANGLTFDRDLGSRVMTIEFRVLPKDEDGNVLRVERDADGNVIGPRKFVIPNLIEHTLANRPQIVTDILTLVLAYWRECQKAGGRPKLVTDTCRHRPTRFVECGVDFLLDAATWLLQGKAGSAYDAFTTSHQHVSQQGDDREAVMLVEETVKAVSESRVSLGRPPITERDPCTAGEIAQAWPPGEKRDRMGEIMHSRRSGAWAGKALGNWLKHRHGIAGATEGMVLRVGENRKTKQATYWFATRK